MIDEKQMNLDNLIATNDKLIVGVSGGPDSMGLLHFLMSIEEKYQIKIIVAHINHHTREVENQKEQEMIEKFCLIHQLPFNVGHFKYKGKANFHEEARNFRYAYFYQLTKKLSGNKIVLAHHEDDQVETILFKITRGNHIGGYIGMKEKVDIGNGIFVIRPFLHIKKGDILKYCEENQVPYAIDSSNLSNQYTRNYLRNEIIPLFHEIQTDFSDKIMQFNEQLSEVYDYIKENAKILFKEMIISCEKDRIILDLSKLKETHQALIRFILIEAVNRIYHEAFDLSYEKVNNLIHIIFNQKPNVTFDLGKNVFCVKEYDKLIFEVGIKEYQSYQVIIDAFKDYTLPNGLKLRVKKVQEKAKINNKTLILCYNSTIWPFIIRTRKNGDTIKTKVGTKKVNRVFIDAKVPVSLRKTWPLLVDREENVLWVIGLQKPDFSDYSSGKENILIEVLN